MERWRWMGLAACMAACAAWATDWPGWRGPDRSGIFPDSTLAPSWPPEGPRLVWRSTEAGKGYSTPSLVASRLYLLGAREGDDEALLAIDATNGRLVWELKFGRTQGGYPGPRSTPTWSDGRLYGISSDGKLLCASQAGSKIWLRDLVKEFGGHCGSWAYAESPLVDGDRVICTPGGPTATLVALDRLTGTTVWTCAISRERAARPGERRRRPYHTAGYASIVPATIGGVRQYIQFLDGGVVGVAAEDGRLLWTYDEPASAVANCTTPIVSGDIVFAASAYKVGGGAARIVRAGDGFEAQPLWFLPDFQNHHGGVVLIDGYLYGTGASELLCVELATGAIAWRNASVGKGSVVAAGRRLFARSEKGPIALVDADPKGYKERGRFSQPDRSSEKAWPHLVVVDGRMYVRDQSLLLCYDVSR